MSNVIVQIAKAIVPKNIKPAATEYYRKRVNYGTRFECSLCEAKLKEFLPFGFDFPVLKEKHVIGGGYREEAKCPVCYSIDRERLLYLYLQQRTQLFDSTHKLLHLAPEWSLKNYFAKAPTIDYLTADIVEGKAMVQMDITKIQYPEATFEAVICNHVLEHIHEDTLAMSEIFRVLKPGGWAILQVPISLSQTETYEDPSITGAREREQAFGQDDHVRIYAMDYVDRLKHVGFNVEVFDWTEHRGTFGGPTNKFNLIEEEKLFIAHKPK